MGTSQAKVLEHRERKNKADYIERWLKMCRHFTPLVYSVDEKAWGGSRAEERRLASHLAIIWNRDYSELDGFVRAHMSTVTVRANTLWLRGQRMNCRQISRRPVWEGGAGASLDAHWVG